MLISGVLPIMSLYRLPHGQCFFDCVNMVVYIIVVLQSQALRHNTYIGMFAQARPPMPCIRLVIYIIIIIYNYNH